jgi:hypothetical protein
VCIVVLLAAVLFVAVRCSGTLRVEAAHMRGEIDALKAAPPVLTAEQAGAMAKTLADLVRANNEFGKAHEALQKEVNDLKSNPPPREDDKKERRDDSNSGGVESVALPDNPHDPRMVFVRIGDVGMPKDTDPELYPVPVGSDHASRWFCMDSQIAKGLVAVSRDTRLRARIIMPSDKKVGWRVWKYVTGNDKVENISLSTSGEYVQLDAWAKGEKVQFYLAKVGDDTTPLQIKLYKE